MFINHNKSDRNALSLASWGFVFQLIKQIILYLFVYKHFLFFSLLVARLSVNPARGTLHKTKKTHFPLEVIKRKKRNLPLCLWEMTLGLFVLSYQPKTKSWR